MGRMAAGTSAKGSEAVLMFLDKAMPILYGWRVLREGGFSERERGEFHKRRKAELDLGKKGKGEFRLSRGKSI